MLVGCGKHRQAMRSAFRVAVRAICSRAVISIPPGSTKFLKGGAAAVAWSISISNRVVSCANSVYSFSEEGIKCGFSLKFIDVFVFSGVGWVKFTCEPVHCEGES